METAISVLEEAVLENSSARSVLGYCHLFGVGVEINEEKEITFFQDGCGMSICAMGAVDYEAGRFDEAVSRFTQASDLESTEAMLRLATCYRCEDGIERDDNRAFQTTSSAADEGNKDAVVSLAVYFMEGIGTRKDRRKATSIFLRAGQRVGFLT